MILTCIHVKHLEQCRECSYTFVNIPTLRAVQVQNRSSVWNGRMKYTLKVILKEEQGYLSHKHKNPSHCPM